MNRKSIIVAAAIVALATVTATAGEKSSAKKSYADVAYECLKRPSVAALGGYIKDKGPQARPRLVIAFPNDNSESRAVGRDCDEKALAVARGKEWKPK